MLYYALDWSRFITWSLIREKKENKKKKKGFWIKNDVEKASFHKRKHNLLFLSFCEV